MERLLRHGQYLYSVIANGDRLTQRMTTGIWVIYSEVDFGVFLPHGRGGDTL